MSNTQKASDSGPRQRILDAAAQVFAEQGFAGARVDEIARRGGINKAMLYYHVGDKAALYEAVLVRNFDRLLEAVHRTLDSGGTPRQRLRALIETFASVVGTMPEHPRMMLREIASGGANMPPEVFDRILNLLGIVRSILSEGVRCGELRDLNPVLTHLSIIGAIVFITSLRPIADRIRKRPEAAGIFPELPTGQADIAEFIQSLLLDGLAATPCTGETP